MSTPEEPRNNWNRLSGELRAYRSAQAETWGGIDDGLLARYLAGECSEVERRQVENIATRYPAVSQAIEVVGDALLERNAEAASGPGSDVSFPDLSDPRTDNSAVTRARDVEIGNKSIFTRPLATWWLAAACVLLATCAGFEFLLIQSQREEIDHLTDQRNNAREEYDKLAHGSKAGVPLVPTSDRQSRPANWLTMAEEVYDPKLSDEENLRSFELYGGERVRSEIATLRKRVPKPTAHEIVEELFSRWGRKETEK